MAIKLQLKYMFLKLLCQPLLYYTRNEQYIEITVSIDRNSLEEHHQTFDEMVGDADKAMFRAKINDRNRIEIV